MTLTGELTVQLNVVPVTSEVKFIEVVEPLHIVWLDGVAFSEEVGFTVTVTMMEEPGQSKGDLGVIVYLAVPGRLSVASKVWVIEKPLPAEAPLTLGELSTVQLNVVPETSEVKFIEVVEPLHIVWLDEVAVTVEMGFTVTGTVMDEPSPQEDVVGVTL